MVKLIIKNPGYIIDFAGITPTRTPAEIDITRCLLNNVIMYLKTHGIDDYQIISDNREQKIKKKKKTPIVEKPKEIASTNEELNKRLDKIEKLLLKVADKESNTVYIEQNIKTEKKKKTEKDPEFIPKMEFTGKLSGNATKQKDVSRDDINEAAKLLKSLKK